MAGRLRTLVSDTMIYGVFVIVGRFLTFMLTPLYTNYIPSKDLGAVTYIFTYLAFINIVYSFGMETSFFRFYSKTDKDETKKVFTHTYISILLLSSIFTVLILLFSGSLTFLVDGVPNAHGYIIYGALIPFFESFMFIPYALLRMNRQAKRFALTRFLLIVLAIILNFLFLVVFRMGGIGVFIAQTITNLVGALFFLPEVLKYIVFKFDKNLFVQMLKFGLPTIPASLSAIVLQLADRPIVKALTGFSTLALYNVNYRLGIPMMLVVSMFEYAWKPFYLSHYEDRDAKQLFSRVLTYFTLLAAVFFLITGFYIEFLVRLPFIGGRFINPVYWSGLGIIPIVLAGYYFNGVFTNLAAGFNITKQTKYLPIAVGAAAIANIALNFILVPFFSIWGAAWATLIGYFISAAILYWYSTKVYPIHYEWGRLLKIVFITLVIYFITHQFSSGLSLGLMLLVRSLALFVYINLLILFGFFNAQEKILFNKLFGSFTSHFHRFRKPSPEVEEFD